MSLSLTQSQLASYIDHTNLKDTVTQSDIEVLCNEAIDYGFCSVCVHPQWVLFAAELLHREKPRVCTVVSFPSGEDTPKSKARQARQAIMNGADEIDMVNNLVYLSEGDESAYINDLTAVLNECRAVKPAVGLKVILETAALTTEQKELACRLADQVGVDFVKTSTGLHPAGGASIDDVTLMVHHAPRCQVKAAGGIRRYQDALAMIEAGASRIGTSASVQIMNAFNETES